MIPAVDLLGDEAVRLERGDYRRIVERRRSPAELVRSFAEAGAPLIHVVDLDGARSGGVRAERLAGLVAVAGEARIQASGGVRSIPDAELLVAAGAERVVVGTAAFADEEALGHYAHALGHRLVVALDARGGRIAVEGWRRELRLSPEEAADRCAEAGVPRLLCTAIERDGTLSGPDVGLLERVVRASGLAVLAAGGVRSERDLEAIAAAGCEGAVVGRALLDGSLQLTALL